MKKIKVVFYQSGEISGTFSPKCFLSSFTGDLEEKTSRLASHDMWQMISVNMYEVREVEMPEFFTEHLYLSHWIDLRFSLALGMPKNFNHVQFFNFINLSEKQRYFVGWILQKYANTKNEFMLEMREKVEAWLNNPDPEYKTPLSPAQFEAAAKYCPLYKAKKISDKVYYSN